MWRSKGLKSFRHVRVRTLNRQLKEKGKKRQFSHLKYPQWRRVLRKNDLSCTWNGRFRWKIQLLAWITSLDKERNSRSNARRISLAPSFCLLLPLENLWKNNQFEKRIYLKFIIDSLSNTTFLERKAISILKDVWRDQETDQSFRHLLRGS